MFNRELLRMMRLEKHLSQAELGALSGLSQSYLCNFERGRYVPSLKHLEAIARALGCSPKALIMDEANSL